MTHISICQSCGCQNGPGATFCEDCGSGLHPDAERHRAPPVEVLIRAPVMSDPATSVKSTDERKHLLSQKVAEMAGQGYRVESQGDFVAVMVTGKRVNHFLHLLIGIFTLGLWWIVWILLALGGGERRQVLTVDEYGNVVIGRRTVG